MPEVDAIIQYGILPGSGDLVDEPDILVQTLQCSPKRTKKEFLGGNKAAQGLLYTNPQLMFQYSAYIGNQEGLADQHPGTQVLELANFVGGIHGFDPEQGIMVYEDPTRDLSNEDAAKVGFTVAHYPFVAG